jgi:hypothetical protein
MVTTAYAADFEQVRNPRSCSRYLAFEASRLGDSGLRPVGGRRYSPPYSLPALFPLSATCALCAAIYRFPLSGAGHHRSPHAVYHIRRLGLAPHRQPGSTRPALARLCARPWSDRERILLGQVRSVLRDLPSHCLARIRAQPSARRVGHLGSLYHSTNRLVSVRDRPA